MNVERKTIRTKKLLVVLLRQKEYFLQPFLENSVASLLVSKTWHWIDFIIAYQHQPFYATKEEKESSLLVENITKKDIHVSIFKAFEKLSEELSLLQEVYFKKEIRKKNKFLH